MTLFLQLVSTSIAFLFWVSPPSLVSNKKKTVKILQSEDFEVDGEGTHRQWTKTNWIAIPPLQAVPKSFQTKAKILYSKNGLYFLFSCEDTRITASMESDFMDLWNEDVIEIFLQPNPKVPAYFEYELSPLNYELPICIFNQNGKLNSWIPFHYEGSRKTRHQVTIHGGVQKSNAEIRGWTSEIFIPFDLLKPILENPPVSGTRWKGNLNRIDYDRGETLWSWQKNSGDFHEFTKFGFFEFE